MENYYFIFINMMSNFTTAFAIFMSMLFITISSFSVSTMNNKNVNYQPFWVYGHYALLTISLLYFIYLVLVYYLSDKSPKFIYSFFIIGSIYLLLFGSLTLHTNEVINTVAPGYKIEKINNDDISIYSILIGASVLVLSYNQIWKKL